MRRDASLAAIGAIREIEDLLAAEGHPDVHLAPVIADYGRTVYVRAEVRVRWSEAVVLRGERRSPQEVADAILEHLARLQEAIGK